MVDIPKALTVSISPTDEACSTFMSSSKWVGCDAGGNERQSPLRKIAEQTVPTKLFHYMWGLGGREMHLAQERLGLTERVWALASGSLLPERKLVLLRCWYLGYWCYDDTLLRNVCWVEDQDSV